MLLMEANSVIVYYLDVAAYGSVLRMTKGLPLYAQTETDVEFRN